MSAGIERPILFSGPMVRAIVDGRKTQTRRAVKPQDTVVTDDDGVVIHLHGERCPGFCDFACSPPKCPFGVVGDRLWVRESLRLDEAGWLYAADDEPVSSASEEASEWMATLPAKRVHCPSIHMPRWACRITLGVIAVRVERLQEIGEADCRSEGVDADDIGKCGVPCYSARQNFERLWDSINAKRDYPWSSNPWVWVLEFKRVWGAP